MTVTAKPAYAPITFPDVLTSSPVWASIGVNHESALKALVAVSSKPGAINGRLLGGEWMAGRFGVQSNWIEPVFADLATLGLIERKSGPRGGDCLRLTWLPTADAPPTNGFLTADVATWRASIADRHVSATWLQPISDAKAALCRRDLLNESEANLCEWVAALPRDGGFPTGRQVLAVTSIAYRVSSEARKLATAAMAAKLAPVLAAPKTPMARVVDFARYAADHRASQSRH